MPYSICHACDKTNLTAAELTDAGQAQAEDLHVLWSDNNTYKTITGDLPTRAIVSPLSR